MRRIFPGIKSTTLLIFSKSCQHFYIASGQLASIINYIFQFNNNIFWYWHGFVLYRSVNYKHIIIIIIKRKKQKYKDLEISLKPKYKQAKFINIVISTFGVFVNSSMDLLECQKTGTSTKHAGITRSRR